MGLASRKLGVPVRWTEDRLEHLAASAHSTGRVTEVEAAFAADGELLGLRYDAVEDVGAYIRAPEPATLYRMHGSLSGAYRVRNVAARNRVVLTNRCPTGLNRGFGGPQLYFALERTMAIAARRLGLDPAELARRNLVSEFPHRTPSGGLYDSGDYEACLDARARARRLRGAPRRAGGRTRARDRARLHRRAVDLEHGLHHAGADGRGARRRVAEVRQRRGLHDLDLARAAGSRSASRRRRRARATARSPRRSSPTASASSPARSRCCPSWTRPRARGRSRRATTRRGSRASARARSLAAADKLAAKIAGIRAHLGADLLAAPRRRNRPLEPASRFRPGWSPASTRPPTSRRRASTRRTATTGSPPPPSHGFLVDVAVVEVDRDTGRGADPRLRLGPRRGPAPQPADRRRPDPRRLRPRRGRRALRADRLRRGRRPPDRHVHGLRLPDRARPAAGEDRPPRDAGAVRRSARRGSARGTRCRRPVAIANAVADALGLDHVELPLTPARVWELMQA